MSWESLEREISWNNGKSKITSSHFWLKIDLKIDWRQPISSIKNALKSFFAALSPSFN